MDEGFARKACTAAIDQPWRAYDAREIRIETGYRNVPARCRADGAPPLPAVAVGQLRSARSAARVSSPTRGMSAR